MTFSNNGDIIYAVHLEEESEKEPMYDSSFKTLDAGDYSSIATIDVKRCIYGVCTNKYDTQIAVIENSREYNSPSESIVRLYDIGRSRDDEDLGSEVEDEEDELEDGSIDDDSSDDDDESMNSEQEMDMLGELFGGQVRDDGLDESGNSDSDNARMLDRSSTDDESDSSYLESSDGSEFSEELFSLNADSNSSGGSST